MGTAGGVRNVSSFFGDEPFLVMAADALTDIDLGALVAAHNENGGIATLAVTQVPNVSEFGVVITDAGGRIQGFQEKPDPAEALSDLASCMIYILEPEIFDYFPDKHAVDFAREVFPALLENDVPFHVHRIDSYWNDVGSLPEYLQGNLDVLEGAVGVEGAGTLLEPIGGEAAEEAGEPGIDGPVLVGEGCELDAGARLDGPLVIGDGAAVGRRRLRQALDPASRGSGTRGGDRRWRHLRARGCARLIGDGDQDAERRAPLVGGLPEHRGRPGDGAGGDGRRGPRRRGPRRARDFDGRGRRARGVRRVSDHPGRRA